MKKILCFFHLFIINQFVSANDGYLRRLNFDVLHYEFALSINDSTDRIDGRASIKIKFTYASDSVLLDLRSKNKENKGMIVSRVTIGAEMAKWRHAEDKLIVFLNSPAKQNDSLELVVVYSGIPEDGLIISKNKFGNRTFFADHWPDRAHNYLPCVDHPYDKATVDFLITAPDKYRVVASGTLTEESDLPGIMTFTHWTESVPIATKVMAFGAAQFAVKSAGSVDNITVWTWVYPENREAGFYDYSVALKPLKYYDEIVGKYPYRKLANVQSKTIYGGLENAGTIFYSENSVTGHGKSEGLIAHEIAHQWFGNSVTEDDWHHIWLSEGFATYLTALYFEAQQGRSRLESDMRSARTKILKYNESHLSPVIDTTVSDLMNLLNPNSYQKGAWVLHMLRLQLGDKVFLRGLQQYYSKYCNSNASTEDFKQVMEEVSGRNLETFFHQWLYLAGQPELKIWKKPGKTKGTFEVYIEQLQKNLFEFNLELLIKDISGEKAENVFIREKVTKITVSFLDDIVIIPDPNVNLLFK